jgi:predicted transcriptional regulator
LRPLRSAQELDAAISMIDKPLDQETIPSRLVSDAEMLTFLIQYRGVTRSEFAKETRIAASTLSEVPSGPRK